MVERGASPLIEKRFALGAEERSIAAFGFRGRAFWESWQNNGDNSFANAPLSIFLTRGAEQKRRLSTKIWFEF